MFEYRRAYRCIGAGLAEHDESSCIWEFGGSIEDRCRESTLHARRPDGVTIIRINIGSARYVRGGGENLSLEMATMICMVMTVVTALRGAEGHRLGRY